MMEKRVKVLGEVWSVKTGTAEEFPALEKLSGYADTSTRTIVADDLTSPDRFAPGVGDVEEVLKSVLRHEILHAFLYESGLDSSASGCESWANNEEMVDWFAIQAPKIFDVYEDLELV